MTKYTDSSRFTRHKQVKEVPPIWRGIGCLMIIFVPVLSFVLATGLMKMAVDQKWPLPYQLLGYPVLSKDLLAIGSLSFLWNFITSIPNLWGVLLFTALFIVIIGAIVSLAYALVYQFVGPPRYGPLDAPPPKIKTRAYKR